MPKVPYTAVPSVAPANVATPTVNENAPAAAFGGTVGQTLEHLGGVEQHVGDEIFKRAMALQDLRNETEAREADAQYMIKSGDLHANFSSLQGQQAVDAYPKYVEDLQNLRTGLRKDMSNDAARKMYDGSSLAFMGRNIFNGAGHAATQMKQAAAGAAVSRQDATLNAIYQDPKNDANWEMGIRSLKADNDAISDIKGALPDTRTEANAKILSKAWAHRITGLAKTEPLAAQEMFEQNKQYLHGDDIDKVENSVRTQVRNTGTRVEALKITDYMREPTKEGQAEKTEAELIKETREKGKELFPNDPLAQQQLENNVTGIYQRNKRVEREAENQHTETINSAIIGNLSGGKIPTSLDELRAVSPAVSAAIDSLPAKKQVAIPGQINRYNAAVNKKTNEQEALRIDGLANNDVEGFLNTDLTKLDLSQKDMMKYTKLQNQKRQNAEGDPRVTRAVNWMKSGMAAQLEALGIYRRTDNNKDDYDHFTGAIQSALEVWQDGHKKPPSYKEFMEQIAPEVIKQRKEPSWFGLSTKDTPFYTREVPKEFQEKVKADVLKRGEPEPTEAQLYQAYVRMLLIQKYDQQKPKQ